MYLASRGHLTIGHAARSRRGTAPTPDSDTSNIWALITSFPCNTLKKNSSPIFVWGGVLIIMHGRSGMTIDPRIPTIPGRRTSGFHRPGRHCLHQARSAARCWASRMKGELHPTKNLFRGGISCIWMTASIYRLISGVATIRDSNGFTM